MDFEISSEILGGCQSFVAKLLEEFTQKADWKNVKPLQNK